jgi:hypothetical protein
MSQAYVGGVTASGLPPSVPTSFVTNINSPAIPASNVLDVFGGSVSTNNNNGVQTDGSNGSNVLTIELTNRILGSVTTTNATPTTLATFALGSTPAVYTFDIQIASFNETDVNGDGYFISGSSRTDGTTAYLCGTPDKIVNEEFGDTADANMIVSGNNVIIQVTGIAGKTHHWRTLATYIEVT